MTYVTLAYRLEATGDNFVLASGADKLDYFLFLVNVTNILHPNPPRRMTRLCQEKSELSLILSKSYDMSKNQRP